MWCLITVILFILSTNTCTASGKNEIPKNKVALGYFANYQAKVKATKLQTKMRSIKNNVGVIKMYIKLQARLEGKLDLCVNRENTMTTLSEEPITIPDLVTTKESTKLPVTTTTEEYFEPTEKPGRITDDYIETTEVPTKSMTTKEYFEPTERPSKTTEEYFEPTERPGMTTEDYFEPTERPDVATEDHFEPTERPDVTTEEYFEPTEKPGMTTEDYFEPTENPGMTTEDYFEPTEMPIMTTDDYPEITDTLTETVPTIVDYPEDVTNDRVQPPTEILIETTTTTMEPWIDTTRSIRTKPWWFTSKRTRKTRSTRSTLTKHTQYHRPSTRRPTTTKKTSPTRRFRSTFSRHTHYHRTSTKRSRSSKRTWTIKKFTMITGRWR